jgi:hypothetical protein
MDNLACATRTSPLKNQGTTGRHRLSATKPSNTFHLWKSHVEKLDRHHRNRGPASTGTPARHPPERWTAINRNTHRNQS